MCVTLGQIYTRCESFCADFTQVFTHLRCFVADLILSRFTLCLRNFLGQKLVLYKLTNTYHVWEHKKNSHLVSL